MVSPKLSFLTIEHFSLRRIFLLLACIVCVSSFVVCRADIRGFVEDGLSSEVSYHANGGSGEVRSSFHTVGDRVILSDGGTLRRSGYFFSGWNTAADGSGTPYATSSSIIIPGGDLHLYAVWVLGHAVRYAGNGNASGTVPASADYAPGGCVIVSENTGSLYKGASWVFSGWNTREDGTGTAYAVGTTFTMGDDAIMLYAVWSQLPGIVGASAAVTVDPGIITGTDQNGNPNSTYYRFATGGSVSLDSPELKFDYNEAFSVSVWFNATSLATALSQYPTIFMQHGGSARFQYLLTCNGEVLTAAVGKCDTGQDIVQMIVSVNTWYHAVMVYDGSKLELYVNGVSRGTVVYGWGACGTPMDAVHLGGLDGGVTPFSGTVGDFRVFGRALSSADVLLLYNG